MGETSQAACDLFAPSLSSTAGFVASAVEDLDAGRTEGLVDLTFQQHYDDLLGRFLGMLEWFRQAGCPQAAIFEGIP